MANKEDKDLSLARQALQFLKLNRVSRVDTSRHLNILLSYEAFSAPEIGDNARLLLKFVRMNEKVSQESDRFMK